MYTTCSMKCLTQSHSVGLSSQHTPTHSITDPLGSCNRESTREEMEQTYPLLTRVPSHACYIPSLSQVPACYCSLPFPSSFTKLTLLQAPCPSPLLSSRLSLILLPTFQRGNTINMPRKKITIKKMEHNYQRTKTFSTRSTGLIKKAHDLSVLCDADVAAVMYSPAGNRKHFPTDKERMGRILERFLKDLASMPQEQRDQYKLSEATVDFLKTLAPVHHRADDSTTQPSQTMEVPSDSSNIVLALKEQASSLEPGMESIQELGKHRALLEHNLQNMMVAESQLPLGGREAGFEGPAQGSDEMPDQGANGKPQQRGNHRRPVQGGNSMLFDLNKEPASSV